MKHRVMFVLALMLMGATFLPIASASAAPLQQSDSDLATASAEIELTNQFGRTIVNARGNHFIVDSAPPLGHPAEEMNPLEAMMGALATCGLFVYEAAAQENDIPLTAAAATVQLDFDVRGLNGTADVDPRVHEFRVHFDLEGPDAEQAAMLAEQFSIRCPLYTTLIKAAPIVITTNEEEMGGPVAEGLATAALSASLSNQPGRAIVNFRDDYIVVDSVPPLGGPNLEVNPMDLLLAAKASCGAVIMERAAIDYEIPLDGLKGRVEADFNPKGLIDGAVSPAIQAMRVSWEIDTDTPEHAQFLEDQYVKRCPILNTLIRATDVEVSHKMMGEDTAPMAPHDDIHGTVGMVITHPSTGAAELIEGATAHLISSEEGAIVQMHAVDLEPGNVYTAWWVIANNPEACEAVPCSAADLVGNPDGVQTEVTLADSVIAGDNGEAHFSSFLPAGEAADDPWFGNGFTNPTGAEIHLVVNTHGPLIPEMAQEMLSSYRGGCTDDSLPAPFPDTAKTDGEAGPNSCALVQAAVFYQGAPHDDIHATVGMVITHPSTGAAELIEGATAHLISSEEGAIVQMHAVDLEPGNVYTAWWVIANDPEACEAVPCSAADLVGNPDGVQTEVTLADSVIAGDNGEAHFSSFLPAGEAADDPWFGNGFTNPTGAEIHLVVNTHGPLIPEMAQEMLSSYRGGCTDDSLPAPFPDTAKTDGEAGPNSCALVQAAVFYQGAPHDDIHGTVGMVITHPSTGAAELIEGATAHLISSEEGAIVQMHAVDLEPGNVYTAWWVIANNPEACEAVPCSAADLVGNPDGVQTEVTLADSVIAGDNGEARFSSFLPAGEAADDPWFGNGFTNPTGAEIHLVVNTHGPLIPEMAQEMLSSYRGGCTDDSLPAPFPDTAKTDGEAGPNSCALVQAAVFYQGME